MVARHRKTCTTPQCAQRESGTRLSAGTDTSWGALRGTGRTLRARHQGAPTTRSPSIKKRCANESLAEHRVLQAAAPCALLEHEWVEGGHRKQVKSLHPRRPRALSSSYPRPVRRACSEGSPDGIGSEPGTHSHSLTYSQARACARRNLRFACHTHTNTPPNEVAQRAICLCRAIDASKEARNARSRLRAGRTERTWRDTSLSQSAVPPQHRASPDVAERAPWRGPEKGRPPLQHAGTDTTTRLLLCPRLPRRAMQRVRAYSAVRSRPKHHHCDAQHHPFRARRFWMTSPKALLHVLLRSIPPRILDLTVRSMHRSSS